MSRLSKMMSKVKSGSKKRTAASVKADKYVKAKHPGNRVSESGNEYTETRPNRSDKDRRRKFSQGGASLSEEKIPENVYWALYNLDRRLVDTTIVVKKQDDGAFIITPDDNENVHVTIEKDSDSDNEKMVHSFLNSQSEDRILVYAAGGTVDSSRVDEVLQNYVMAALWSSQNNDDYENDEDVNLDKDYGIEDINPALLAQWKKDIERFLKENDADIKEAELTDDQIGHSLWLSQNGHGAGFFDYGSEAADRLQEAARKLGSVYLYVQDGKIFAEKDGINEREYAAGGQIKNQYKNRTAKDVWQDWTLEQRYHFLTDHIRMHSHDGHKLETASYDELWPTIREVLKDHVIEGQYAKGGIPNNYEGKTAEQVWDAWTKEQRTHFIEDHFNSYSFANSDTTRHPFFHSLMKFVDLKFENIPDVPVKSALDSALYNHTEHGQYEKGGQVGLKVETRNDLEEVAKYMAASVKKRNWDLKDLVHYFEQENGFDYKVRVKVWDEMDMYNLPKTYDNILKLLEKIVEGNGKMLADNSSFAKGGKIASADELIQKFSGKISSEKSIKDFFQGLYDIDVAFHPDDDFNDIVETETNKKTFTKKQADALNKIMEDCFAWCSKHDKDIYDISMPVMRKEFKKRGIMEKGGQPKQITASEEGNWIDGNRGIYQGEAIISTAESYGFVVKPEDAVNVDPDGEFYYELVDEAIEYLNTLAPEGYHFGNNESGDFGLWKNEEEEQLSEADQQLQSAAETAEKRIEEISTELSAYGKPFMTGIPMQWYYRTEVSGKNIPLPDKYIPEMEELTEKIADWKSRMLELEFTSNMDVGDDEEYGKGGKIKTFAIGDLVWAKNEGHAGLTGLVVSGDYTEDGDDEVVQDIYFRGLSGAVYPTPVNELQDLIGSDGWSKAVERSDISMYESIAKRKGIKLNPKYAQAMDDDADEFAKGGVPKSYREQHNNSKELWDAWDVTQRNHFLKDHFQKMTEETALEFANSSWYHLPKEIQIQVDEHIREGRYARGGKPRPKSVYVDTSDDKLVSIKEKSSGDLKTLYPGRYITLATQGGKLHIFLTDAGKEWIEENGPITYQNVWELFEDIAGSSEILYHDNLGESGFGLTDAPGITDGYYYNDNGELVESEDGGNLWYYNNYAIKDPWEELTKNGEVDFDGHNDNRYARGGGVQPDVLPNDDGDSIFAEGGETKEEYIEVNGTFYREGTPQQVIDVLENARQTRKRILLDYGHTEGENAGKSWGEIYDVRGYVGRSTGTSIPILVYNAKSHGGTAIFTNRIVKISESAGGKVLYQHPNYQPYEENKIFEKGETMSKNMQKRKVRITGGNQNTIGKEGYAFVYPNGDASFPGLGLFQKKNIEILPDDYQLTQTTDDKLWEIYSKASKGENISEDIKKYGPSFFPDFMNYVEGRYNSGHSMRYSMLRDVINNFKSNIMTTEPRIPNTEAQPYVENRMPFKGSNLEGKITDNGDYIVLSFGHYPIWYYNTRDKKWYGNKSKYCQVTAMHISQTRPNWDAEILSHGELLDKIRTDESKFSAGGSVMLTDMIEPPLPNIAIASDSLPGPPNMAAHV